jgi:cytochrome b pre-mRNA-processing protein 6
LRPESQFQEVMRKRVDRQLLTPSAGTTTQTQTPALPKLADEMEQVNALYSLIENRYSRKV